MKIMNDMVGGGGGRDYPENVDVSDIVAVEIPNATLSTLTKDFTVSLPQDIQQYKYVYLLIKVSVQIDTPIVLPDPQIEFININSMYSDLARWDFPIFPTIVNASSADGRRQSEILIPKYRILANLKQYAGTDVVVCGVENLSNKINTSVSLRQIDGKIINLKLYGKNGVEASRTVYHNVKVMAVGFY